MIPKEDEFECFKCHKKTDTTYIQDYERCKHCGEFMELVPDDE